MSDKGKAPAKDIVSIWGLRDLFDETRVIAAVTEVESEDETFGEPEYEIVGASVFGSLFGRP